MSSDIERISIGEQAKVFRFYPYSVELEREVTLYNRRRVFGANTTKRGARVRRTDST